MEHRLEKPLSSGQTLIGTQLPEQTNVTHSSVGELLEIHEYERKRLGQELHDSAGQLLVALRFSLSRLREVAESPKEWPLIDEIGETVSQIDEQIRGLAFMHYPAELAGRDLSSALQMLVSGFSRGSGIRTSFTLLGAEPVAGSLISLAILRVAQEALVNVHRHSHASSAKVVLQNRAKILTLSILDNGVGMPASRSEDNRQGIGLQGMRHRVEEAGGELDITELPHGTKISATVPLAA
jgi:signal transduction histidine kinase